MTKNGGTKAVPRRKPESAVMVENIKRSMAITARLNRLSFNDGQEVRALFTEPIGQSVDDGFFLMPPFYTDGGSEIRIGKNVL